MILDQSERPPLVPSVTKLPPPMRSRPARHKPRRTWIAVVLIVMVVAAAAGFYGVRAYRSTTSGELNVVPTATVQRSDLTLTITAKGELRGGNPQTLAAPMTGGTEMHLTALRKTGESVTVGEVIAQFDTSEQQFKLKEAEADLKEADENLIKAQAQRDADREEDSYALLKAQNDLKIAELEARKNPLLSTIVAKENSLAVEGARDHLAQTEKNLNNRKATGEAGIAMQQAARAKAEAQATTAGQNIEAMTLKSNRAGYVAVKPNSSGNFFFSGMTLPFFQIGDTVRPGMAIAEIPDMKNWEIAANVGELDRGHLQPGNEVQIEIVAVPEHRFQGKVKELGGMTGAFWDRHFECKMTLLDASPELRPGMSARITVTTDHLHNVLSLPTQALFESDGRSFVYVRSGGSFVSRNITLVRRNETRAVVTGLKDGEVVALANPTEQNKRKAADASPLKTVGK